MRSRGLVGVVAIGAAAVACASASAKTFCVPADYQGCPDQTYATLAEAVTAANGNADADQILIAPGAFTVSPGVTATAGHPVQIVGAGIERTVLQATSTGVGDTTTLALDDPADTVTDLTIQETAAGHDTALALDGGSARRVRADQRSHDSSNVYAVQLRHGASFADGEALTATPQSANTPASIQIANDAGQVSRVSGSLIQGWYGVATTGAGSAVVSRSRITGAAIGYAVAAFGADTTVEDSTIAGGPVTVYANTAQSAVLNARHLTLNAQQVQAIGTYAGSTAHAVVDNSAFVGGGPEFTQMLVQATSPAQAVLDLTHSFYAGDDHVDRSGTGVTYNGAANNVVGSDAKLLPGLQPAFDSPLVDAGGTVPSDESPVDLGGEQRTVNGRSDIGAYEYGRHAPTIAVGVYPSVAVFVGDPVRFVADVQDADPGEVPAVTWTFDDGTTATGADVTHAFATPGTHSATALATDPVGLTAQAVASVPVISPSVLNKPMAPAFAFARLTARKGVVRVLLRCPASATDCAGALTLQLAPKPKAKGAKAVVLGRAHYAVRHGTKRTVRLKLTRSARRRLARARRGVWVRVVAKPRDAASRSKTVRLTGR